MTRRRRSFSRVANACAERSEPIGTSVERGRGGGGHQRVTLAGPGFEDPRGRSRDAFASDAATRRAASVASRRPLRLPLPWVFSCAFAGAPRRAARDRRARRRRDRVRVRGAGAFPRRGSGWWRCGEKGPPGRLVPPSALFRRARVGGAGDGGGSARALGVLGARPSRPPDGGGVLWISGEDFDADAVRHACAFAGAGAATVSFSGSGSSSGSASASGLLPRLPRASAPTMSSALVACGTSRRQGRASPAPLPSRSSRGGRSGRRAQRRSRAGGALEYLPGGGARAVEPRRGGLLLPGPARGVRGIVAPSRGPAGGGTPVAPSDARGRRRGFALASGDRAAGSASGRGGGGGEGRRRRRRARCVRPGEAAQGRVEALVAGLEDALVPGGAGSRARASSGTSGSEGGLILGANGPRFCRRRSKGKLRRPQSG